MRCACRLPAHGAVPAGNNDWAPSVLPQLVPESGGLITADEALVLLRLHLFQVDVSYTDPVSGVTVNRRHVLDVTRSAVVPAGQKRNDLVATTAARFQVAEVGGSRLPFSDLLSWRRSRR